MDFGSPNDRAEDRIVVTPLREIAAESIRRWIFTGTVRPGQMLTQDDVAGRLGISRMPVREAFQLLAHDGLLVLEARRRAVVRSLTRDEIVDHYEVRALIEGEAAALAVRNYQAESDPILAIFSRGVAAARKADPILYQSETECFHRAIWIAAKRPRLSSLAEQLWTGLPPHLAEFLPEQLEGSVQEHKALIAAFESRSAAAARKAMRIHILQSMRRFLGRYQGGALEVSAATRTSASPLGRSANE